MPQIPRLTGFDLPESDPVPSEAPQQGRLQLTQGPTVEQGHRTEPPERGMGHQPRPGKVVDQRVGVDVVLGETLAVKRHVPAHAQQGLLEPLQLQLGQLGPVHGLELRFETLAHGYASFSRPRYARRTSRLASSSSDVPDNSTRPVSST